MAGFRILRGLSPLTLAGQYPHVGEVSERVIIDPDPRCRPTEDHPNVSLRPLLRERVVLARGAVSPLDLDSASDRVTVNGVSTIQLALPAIRLMLDRLSLHAYIVEHSFD